MTQIPQISPKPHACVIDVAEEIRMHTAMDQDAVSICMEIADEAQQVACETVRDLFEFWRIIQGAGIDVAHIMTHYEIFKGVRKCQR